MVVEAARGCLANPLRAGLGALAIAVAVGTMALVVTGLDGFARYGEARERAGVRQRHLRPRARHHVEPEPEGTRGPARAQPSGHPDRRALPRALRRRTGALRAGRAAAGRRHRRRAEVRERVGQRHRLDAVRHPRSRHRPRPVHPSRRRGSGGPGGGDRDGRRRRPVPRRRSARAGSCASAAAGSRSSGRRSARARAAASRSTATCGFRCRRSSGCSARPDSLQVFARGPDPERVSAAEDRVRITMRARRQLAPGKRGQLRHPHARGRARVRAAASRNASASRPPPSRSWRCSPPSSS